MQDCKPISTPFRTDVKLSSKMSPSSEKEMMEMSRVPYASAVGSLMFAMICTRPRHCTCSRSSDLDGSKSTTGYVFTLSSRIVSWVLKLQSVVAMSTTEAEYVASAQASKEAVWNPAFHSKTKHIRVEYHFIREKVEKGIVDMQKIHTDDNVADYLTKAINRDKFICHGVDLVPGLVKNGKINRAVCVFDEMPDRDVISYTSLIDGFVKKVYYECALEWFQEMQASGDQPDLVTIVSALSACANLRALGLGLWLHRIVLEGNMLIDNHVQMQSRILEFNYCGLCFKWKSEESLKYLYWMQQDGLKPDGVTFTGALTACSHAGLVDE
ncbi:gag-pol polyprotein, partial [Tanacetum coccineum]